MECTLRDLGSTFVFGMLLGAILEFWIDVVWRIIKDKKGGIQKFINN